MNSGMFQIKPVKIDDLLLDPNNPRFTQDLNIREPIPDDQVESKQIETRRRFDVNVGNNDETEEELITFEITDLLDSMRTIGYVGIDRVVVRPLDCSGNKYVVVEGNRRISAAKKLIDLNNQSARPQDRLDSEILKSLEEIPVMVLHTDGLQPDEIQRRISVILGLRHYGSLLEWEPLPRAFNIYENYMQLQPRISGFALEQRRVKEVAGRLSISQAEVKKSLKTYIVFLQISENHHVKDEHYSLIQAAITNRYLPAHGYFNIDDSTYRLDDPSIERLNRVSQFSNREQLKAEKKIVKDPKSFTQLGKLVHTKSAEVDEVVKNFAAALLSEVENGDVSLDSAIDKLTNLKNRKNWVDFLAKELKKQKEELKIEDYKGIGNDLMYKNELESTLGKFRRIMDL